MLHYSIAMIEQGTTGRDSKFPFYQPAISNATDTRGIRIQFTCFCWRRINARHPCSLQVVLSSLADGGQPGPGLFYGRNAMMHTLPLSQWRNVTLSRVKQAAP
jgi:hypothetical protein